MASTLSKSMFKDDSERLLDSKKSTMIKVDHVTMDFNSANQQLNSLKEYFIALAKHELMFKSFRALDDVSLEVQKGDVFGILGTNGSGKSTLLKIISGVLDPTNGEVLINGNIAPLIEMGAGFDFDLTARENIYLNGSLLGYRKSFIEEHFDEIVDFAEIHDFLDMPLKNYSSGMVSRIAFAIATVIVPEILIVDEVLAVGDFMFRQKCERRIQNLIHDHGTTVLIVSHDSRQIERLCNKAIWIEKGHTKMIGEAKEVSRVYQSIGGHKGSKEAEAEIFSLATRTLPRHSIRIEEVFAPDIYSICTAIADETISDEGISSVVIVPGNDATACICGLNICSASQGVLLMTRENEVPETTSHFLTAHTIDNLFIVNSEKISERVIAEIKADLNSNTVVHAFDHHSLVDLTADVFEFLSDQRALCNSLSFIAEDRTGYASRVFASVLASEASIFRVWDPKTIPMQSLIRDMENVGSNELMLIGNSESIVGDILSLANAAGIQIYSFDDEKEWRSAANITEWLLDRIHAERKTVRALYIVSADSSFTSYAVASKVARDDGIILMLDRNDLDCMNWASKFIASISAELEKIVFVGQERSFSSIDKHILQASI